MKKLMAFTLAEILIVLAILGVIAILTLPNLIENYQEKAHNTAADLFSKRLSDTVKRMQINGDLMTYSTTSDFVAKGLKKYIKIDKICDKGHLTDCFVSNIIMDGENLDTSKLQSGENFGLENWETEPVAIMFNNGTTAIFLYNPSNNYYQDYIGPVDTVQVLAGLYDVNAYNSPNEYLDDIRPLGISLLKTEKPLMTCEDLKNNYVDAATTRTTCKMLANGHAFFYVAEASSTEWTETYDVCKSQCENHNGHMMTYEDMMSMCSAGESFPWWHWIDRKEDTGSQGTAVYGACTRIEQYSKNKDNFTCGCIGN